MLHSRTLNSIVLLCASIILLALPVIPRASEKHLSPDIFGVPTNAFLSTTFKMTPLDKLTTSDFIYLGVNRWGHYIIGREASEEKIFRSPIFEERPLWNITSTQEQFRLLYKAWENGYEELKNIKNNKDYTKLIYTSESGKTKIWVRATEEYPQGVILYRWAIEYRKPLGISGIDEFKFIMNKKQTKHFLKGLQKLSSEGTKLHKIVQFKTYLYSNPKGYFSVRPTVNRLEYFEYQNLDPAMRSLESAMKSQWERAHPEFFNIGTGIDSNGRIFLEYQEILADLSIDETTDLIKIIGENLDCSNEIHREPQSAPMKTLFRSKNNKLMFVRINQSLWFDFVNGSQTQEAHVFCHNGSLPEGKIRLAEAVERFDEFRTEIDNFRDDLQKNVEAVRKGFTN